jgi:hypothetical protein
MTGARHRRHLAAHVGDRCASAVISLALDEVDAGEVLLGGDYCVRHRRARGADLTIGFTRDS